MSPNDDTRDEELLARYRRASADAPGPSDAVRAAILAESRRLAEQLAKQAPRSPLDVSRPAANDSRWKITAFGTAGAALLAALLFAPRYWENSPPVPVSTAPPPAPAFAAIQAQTKGEAPKLEEVKPDAAPSYTEPARQSPNESDLQETVVTGAKRRASKSNAAPSPNPGAPAPTLPPRVAQNYAPGSPSASPSASNFIVAPPAPAARLGLPELSAQAAQAAVGGVLPKPADRATAADSALKPATLQSAVAQDDVTQTATLLDQGAVIDARDESGRTPLMLAVSEDRLEIVRLLLSRGADPNAADNSGHTPLQQATKRNLRDIAALLEQAGAH
jgi:Ankyrin repeats (3 copies)